MHSNPEFLVHTKKICSAQKQNGLFNYLKENLHVLDTLVQKVEVKENYILLFLLETNTLNENPAVSQLNTHIRIDKVATTTASNPNTPMAHYTETFAMTVDSPEAGSPSSGTQQTVTYRCGYSLDDQMVPMHQENISHHPNIKEMTLRAKTAQQIVQRLMFQLSAHIQELHKGFNLLNKKLENAIEQYASLNSTDTLLAPTKKECQAFCQQGIEIIKQINHFTTGTIDCRDRRLEHLISCLDKQGFLSSTAQDVISTVVKATEHSKTGSLQSKGKKRKKKKNHAPKVETYMHSPLFAKIKAVCETPVTNINDEIRINHEADQLKLDVLVSAIEIADSSIDPRVKKQAQTDIKKCHTILKNRPTYSQLLFKAITQNDHDATTACVPLLPIDEVLERIPSFIVGSYNDENIDTIIFAMNALKQQYCFFSFLLKSLHSYNPNSGNIISALHAIISNTEIKKNISMKTHLKLFTELNKMGAGKQAVNKVRGHVFPIANLLAYFAQDAEKSEFFDCFVRNGGTTSEKTDAIFVSVLNKDAHRFKGIGFGISSYLQTNDNSPYAFYKDEPDETVKRLKDTSYLLHRLSDFSLIKTLPTLFKRATVYDLALSLAATVNLKESFKRMMIPSKFKIDVACSPDDLADLTIKSSEYHDFKQPGLILAVFNYALDMKVAHKMKQLLDQLKEKILDKPAEQAKAIDEIEKSFTKGSAGHIIDASFILQLLGAEVGVDSYETLSFKQRLYNTIFKAMKCFEYEPGVSNSELRAFYNASASQYKSMLLDHTQPGWYLYHPDLKQKSLSQAQPNTSLDGTALNNRKTGESKCSPI